MKRILLVIFLIAVAVAVTACSDSPSGLPRTKDISCAWSNGGRLIQSAHSVHQYETSETVCEDTIVTHCESRSTYTTWCFPAYGKQCYTKSKPYRITWFDKNNDFHSELAEYCHVVD